MLGEGQCHRPSWHCVAYTPGGLEKGLVIKKKLGAYPLRLLTSMKASVAEISKADGTSINQFVTTAVAEEV